MQPAPGRQLAVAIATVTQQAVRAVYAATANSNTLCHATRAHKVCAQATAMICCNRHSPRSHVGCGCKVRTDGMSNSTCHVLYDDEQHAEAHHETFATHWVLKTWRTGTPTTCLGLGRNREAFSGADMQPLSATTHVQMSPQQHLTASTGSRAAAAPTLG